jgi:hypothetical protein
MLEATIYTIYNLPPFTFQLSAISCKVSVA